MFMRTPSKIQKDLREFHELRKKQAALIAQIKPTIN